jgi:hypothetical protein
MGNDDGILTLVYCLNFMLNFQIIRSKVMTRSPGHPANFVLRTIILMHLLTFNQRKNLKKLCPLPLWLLLTCITRMLPNHTIFLRPVTVHPILTDDLISQVLTLLKSLRIQLSFHVLAPGLKNSIMVYEALMAIILRSYESLVLTKESSLI